MDVHVEIGKITIRARVTKIDIGWRVLALALLGFAGLIAIVLAG